MKDKNREVRGAARDSIDDMLMLGDGDEMLSEAKAAIPDLIKGLKKGENKDVRIFAASLLAQIGSEPEAKAAISALTEMLKDEDEEVCANGADALWNIDYFALIESLKDERVRKSATQFLTRIIPDLKNLLREENP